MRGGAEVACQAHNLKVVGSSPTPATNFTSEVFVCSTIQNIKCIITYKLYKRKRCFEMEINSEKKNGITCLKIEGSLDASNSSIAKKSICDIIATEGVNLIIDFSRLQYISSAGLRVILIAAKDIKAKNGKIVLCSMTDNVRKDFDISAFTSMFDIQDNIEAALKRF